VLVPGILLTCKPTQALVLLDLMSTIAVLCHLLGQEGIPGRTILQPPICRREADLDTPEWRRTTWDEVE